MPPRPLPICQALATTLAACGTMPELASPEAIGAMPALAPLDGLLLDGALAAGTPGATTPQDAALAARAAALRARAAALRNQ
jgi:hypothetical protein